jgi:uncharacterized membrane protein YkvA (DUF1232 family)
MGNRGSPERKDLPYSRVLERLSPGVRTHLQNLLDEALVPADELFGQVDDHLARIEQHAAQDGFVDVELARTLTKRCRRLLESCANKALKDHGHLVQAAVRYFVLDEDGDSDIASIIGFDDDALVIELVAREIGREDVLD